MSQMCLFVIRNVRGRQELQTQITQLSYSKGYGVCYEPFNSLLLEGQLVLETDDVVFEPTDSPDCDAAELLLEHYCFGTREQEPLLKRMQFIQSLAQICMKYSRTVEIFLSDDDGCLSDYAEYNVEVPEIAKVLFREYMKMGPATFALPCVHLIIDAYLG